MPPNAVLAVVLAVLGLAAIPAWIWARAQRRIRHLEMTLLAQSTDLDRYDELKQLIQQVALQTEQLADQQARLGDRLSEWRELPGARSEQPRDVTPH